MTLILGKCPNLRIIYVAVTARAFFYCTSFAINLECVSIICHQHIAWPVTTFSDHIQRLNLFVDERILVDFNFVRFVQVRCLRLTSMVDLISDLTRYLILRFAFCVLCSSISRHLCFGVYEVCPKICSGTKMSGRSPA